MQYPSVRQFHVSLYEEYLEEAAFLYEQRQNYLQDAEVTWRELQAWENRFEAHLDGLYLGEALAMDVCHESVGMADIGELHTILSVFIRHGRKKSVFGIVENLEIEDEETFLAVSNAFILNMPASWQADIVRYMRWDYGVLASLFARVAGYRRLQPSKAFDGLLSYPELPFYSWVVWAGGRFVDEKYAQIFNSQLRHDEATVNQQAAVALARLGDKTVMRDALQVAGRFDWAAYLVAVFGDATGLNVLQDGLRGNESDSSRIYCMGLIGHLRAVPMLFELLNDDELNGAAASALHLITNADLYDDVFVEDEIHEDELTDSELSDYHAGGELPKKANGEPFGESRIKLSTSQKRWKNWLSQNKGRFDRSVRWRLGEPYSRRVLVKGLVNDTADYRFRATVLDELVANYKMSIPFEVDLLVAKQLPILRQIIGWIDAK